MEVGEAINCTVVEEGVICNGTIFSLPEQRLTYLDEWFWIYLSIYVTLVLLAGLVSGLTMGLLSLDMMTLKIMKAGGSPKEKKYAAKILPVVERHHLLLVTLLLVNAAAVEAMPIFLDRVSDPIIAIVVSVSAVLLFGEVFPQALCTRYGVAIGATLVPFVYVLMGLVFVIAWPLSKLLDCALGKDHDTFYRRAQLKVLVDLHGPTNTTLTTDPDSKQNEQLSVDEVLIIKGALDMKDKVVGDAMLPLQSVYMLSEDSKLDKETMTSILSVAHSRIPVYSGSRDNILGLLLVKMLIKLDPEDSVPVKSLLEDSFCFRKVPSVYHNMALFDLLNLFQTGKSHLCIVERCCSTDDDNINVNTSPEDHTNISPVDKNIVGIITLEDVIEELIQEEIIDETDVFVDVKNRVRVARAKAARQLSSHEQATGRPDAQSSSGPSLPSRQLSDDQMLDISTDPSAPLLADQEIA